MGNAFNLGMLVGLRLEWAGYAGNMRTFGFTDGATEWALHVQCAWRLEDVDGVITGRDDWSLRADGSCPDDDWDPAAGGSLQQVRLQTALLDKSGEGVVHNRTQHGVVRKVSTSNLGDVVVTMTGGYRLVIFPGASMGEEWRVFKRNNLAPHLVWETGEDVI